MDALKSFIDRINRLEEEKKTISEDIKGVFQEAKGQGLDPKILKTVAAIIRNDAAKEHAENSEILDTYLAALGATVE